MVKCEAGEQDQVISSAKNCSVVETVSVESVEVDGLIDLLTD